MKAGKNISALALVLATSTALFSGCAAHRYGGATPQDVEISKKVQKTLAMDTIYGYPDVEVYTADGNTELKGYAKCWEQKDRAGNLAMFSKGVQGVQNNIVQQQ